MDPETKNTELSEGEITESPNRDEPDGDGEPKAKKPKLEASPEDGGNWESVPSKKQLKKMTRNRQREKRMHQQLEDKLAAMTSHASDSTHLNARQAEVIECLVRMASGNQHNRAMVQKLKTIQFQGVISHLVTGSPSIVQTPPSNGAGDLCRDYKVVVIWMSMVSGDFFRNHSGHFAKVKKLHPCVMFDIEHPGSTRFVKLGLESFMMLASNEDGSTPLGASVAEPPKADAKPRWAYLFSMGDLSDNDFPHPSRQGGVDQLGRDISTYFSIVEWPACEVCDSPEVSAAKGGCTGGMPMFAVDCEMVETRLGSELARISIVNESLECIYDTYVKPDCPVVDYRTKYSGLSEEILEDVTTTLKDVQAHLPTLLPSNSILIGHSLENDFHAMRFRHPFVIDTSWIFTPLATPTAKPGLRKVCKELLAVDIQNSDRGHNSVEDATTCMKLVHLKLEKGESCKIAFNDIAPSIFMEYRTKGCTTGMVDKESVTRLFGKGSSFSAAVKTDEEAVSHSAEIISQSKFTFVQLHSIEYLLKSADGKDQDKIEATAELMDSHVCKVVEGCPPKTLVFVVCGSSDIRKVRRMQQEDVPNMQLLKKQVMLARTGCVVGVIVN